MVPEKLCASREGEGVGRGGGSSWVNADAGEARQGRRRVAERAQHVIK